MIRLKIGFSITHCFGFMVAFFLLSPPNSHSATTKTFSGVSSNTVQNGFNYTVPPEGAPTGGVIDTVTLAALPATVNLGTPGVLIFEFLAPTGQQFQLNGTKYTDRADLSFKADLFGFSSATLSGGSVTLLNPTGGLSSYTLPPSSQSLISVPFYNKVRFSSDVANIAAAGTFTGIQFSFNLSGLSDVPVTWSGYSSDSTVLLPSFTASANTSSNNGPVLTLVPEPATLSLLTVGLGGLAMMRRRRS